MSAETCNHFSAAPPLANGGLTCDSCGRYYHPKNARTDLPATKTGDELLEVWRHKMLPILNRRTENLDAAHRLAFLKVTAATETMIQTLADWKTYAS